MILQACTRKLESAASIHNRILPAVQDFDVELEIERAPGYQNCLKENHIIMITTIIDISENICCGSCQFFWTLYLVIVSSLLCYVSSQKWILSNSSL